jgi:hypothetical protein
LIDGLVAMKEKVAPQSDARPSRAYADAQFDGRRARGQPDRRLDSSRPFVGLTTSWKIGSLVLA